jgi:transposase
MKKSRTKHSPAFKAKVALAALKEEASIAEIARRHKVHPTVVYKWKHQLSENVAKVFESDGADSDAAQRETELLRKIGELTVERDSLSSGLDRVR